MRDGQFKLNEFILIDATAKTIDCGKVEDLTPLCVQANIYESILEPCVRAQFEFYEAKGLFENLKLDQKKIIQNHLFVMSFIFLEFLLRFLLLMIKLQFLKSSVLHMKCENLK